MMSVHSTWLRATASDATNKDIWPVNAQNGPSDWIHLMQTLLQLYLPPVMTTAWLLTLVMDLLSVS